MSILPKASTIKILMVLFTEIEKNNPKIHMVPQKISHSQNNPE